MAQNNLERWVISGKPAYSLVSRFFTVDGNRYEIFWTTSTGPRWYDAIHEFRDESGKEYKQTMSELVKRLLQYETIEVSKNAVR